ncbi:hypothetical protein ACE2AJ_16875 [Aquihabitans daechungensis]
MHRRRLDGIGIDGPSEADLATASFWSALLDAEASTPTGSAVRD